MVTTFARRNVVEDQGGRLMKTVVEPIVLKLTVEEAFELYDILRDDLINSESPDLESTWGKLRVELISLINYRDQEDRSVRNDHSVAEAYLAREQKKIDVLNKQLKTIKLEQTEMMKNAVSPVDFPIDDYDVSEYPRRSRSRGNRKGKNR